MAIICGFLCSSMVSSAQDKDDTQKQMEPDAKAGAELKAKAAGWVASLNLGDATKAERVQQLIVTHLEAVRDWNNEHPFTAVPAGINPVTGNKLSDLDRQIIINSAKPKTVHDDLMNGLRKDLTTDQVNAILDKYTIGKVDFTINGYKAIVPDLTAEEATKIRGFLEQAREQAIDYKSMKQVSAIFEIYKTKCEQYLDRNGRNWSELFKAYVNAQNKKKASMSAQKVKGAPVD